MEIILLERIQNLGSLGDQVTVKAGYARNFLFPQNKAVRATKENLAKFEGERAELEKAAEQKILEAKQRLAAVEDMLVTVVANASPEGKLFGSVGPAEIAEAITAQGKPVEKREVQLGEGPFHTTGEFEAVLRFHSDVETTIRVNVVAAED